MIAIDLQSCNLCSAWVYVDDKIHVMYVVISAMYFNSVEIIKFS